MAPKAPKGTTVRIASTPTHAAGSYRRGRVGSPKVTESLSAMARQSQKQNQIMRANQTQSTVDFGQAAGSIAGRAYRPALARTAAGVQAAQSRARQAATGDKIMAASNDLYRQVAPAQATGQQEALARVAANAEPGVISAKSAIAQANAYAKSIGIKMKEMDWSAKANVYAQVMSQNNDILKMKYAEQLDEQKLKYQYDLSQGGADLTGAGQVVSNVDSSMPNLINQIHEDMNNAEIVKAPAASAQAWAASQTVDPHAQSLLASLYSTLLLGASSHTLPNGALDGNWVRNQVVAGVHTLYPTYGGDSTITAALSDSVLSSVMGTDAADIPAPGTYNGPGGWRGEIGGAPPAPGMSFYDAELNTPGTLADTSGFGGVARIGWDLNKKLAHALGG